MRIGISVLTHVGQSIWENGIGQNVIYLAKLLAGIPFVKDVLLLNCGDQECLPPEAASGEFSLRLVSPRDATHLIDVAIELSGGLDVQWLDHIRALGKKVVFHACGQPYAALIEPTIFSRSGFFTRPDRCDEVWILSKDAPFRSMLEAIHRCPVFEVPYLWNADFLDKRAKTLTESGVDFGYIKRTMRSPDNVALRVAIFEPNISVTKSSTIPLLICDLAYQKNPLSISKLNVMNSLHVRTHPTFSHMTDSLNLAKDGRINYEHRHDFAGYMAQFGDAVVSHQWQNNQNTLYLDALHGGYPLVHNSAWLCGVGYRYDDFDVAQGAQQLLLAFENHDANLEAYGQNAQSFLRSLSPLSQNNRTVYARRLLKLMPESVLG